MSLERFQRFVADAASTPALCVMAAHDADAAFAPYRMTPRERRRARALAADDAMAVYCTLYRVNRIIPLYSVLPITMYNLRDRLRKLLEEFWESSPAETQYEQESARFARWLQSRLGSERAPATDAVLFERACQELWSTAGTQRRVVEFAYDPVDVLSSAPAPAELSNPMLVTVERDGGELRVDLSGG